MVFWSSMAKTPNLGRHLLIVGQYKVVMSVELLSVGWTNIRTFSCDYVPCQIYIGKTLVI
jgi:hypothetical protein